MNPGALSDVDVLVRREDPSSGHPPRWVSYNVRLEPRGRVLDALHYIRWHIDGSLGFRRSCAHGVCGSDAMMINGVNRLACAVLWSDLQQPIRIEPLPGFKVEKDLIVDMGPFFDGYRAVMPWLINEGEPPDRERLQSPAERRRFDDTTKCILCAACTSSCPIYWGDRGYIGPAAIVNAHRFIFDSRDQGAAERLEILSSPEGAFRCRTIFNCTDACPRGIRVTEAIQEVKRASIRKQP
ncbi:MAG: succinate dehydrogenase iron-sulfur subunit [Actinomycetota bacterium]|nr:succinate dehydrogenase iron-sulfur subunit [Actinomycetota bacterium]